MKHPTTYSERLDASRWRVLTPQESPATLQAFHFGLERNQSLVGLRDLDGVIRFGGPLDSVRRGNGGETRLLDAVELTGFTILSTRRIHSGSLATSVFIDASRSRSYSPSMR